MATLSGGVLLLFIMVAIVCYQLTAVFVKKREIAVYEARIAYLNEKLEETEDEIEKWNILDERNRLFLWCEAKKRGWEFPDNEE